MLSPLSVDVLDEAAVDLQPVDLVRVDVAERGVAGAEIVELEMDAGGADMAQLGGDAGLLVVEDDGFDDFQRQLLRRQAGLLQRREQERVEIRLAQLGARDVDRQPAEDDAGAVPFGRLARSPWR